MRILVGLSGGVDSAVAAYLLQQQGHELIGGFMKNYADPDNPNCHTRQDRDMAIRVAHYLGIDTFVIFDFRKEYHERIISYIYQGYQAGLTPNPDVLCNTLIKFDLFANKAIQLGCDAIATGHYARISKDSKNGTPSYHLLKGVDTTKDQSYFLSGLTQTQLAKAIFPLGELTKSEVRQLAHKIGLPNADRKDSQGLCFIGNVPIKEFLAQAIPKKTGDIVDIDGHVLGQHDGAHFVTLGQRTGLGLSGGPRYVVAKDTHTNTITVSKDQQQDLYHSHLLATHRHRIDPNHHPDLPFSAYAKIRYRQEDQACTVTYPQENSPQKQESKTPTLQFAFHSPQRAISPGQIIVLYDRDIVLGSGIIQTYW